MIYEKKQYIIEHCDSRGILATLSVDHADEMNTYDNLVFVYGDFSHKNLEGASFVNTSAIHSDFRNSDLYGAHISSCNFSFSVFQNADLRAGIIFNTIFHRADFRGCNCGRDNLGGETFFVGCDFTEIIIDEKTNFCGAYYDDSCRFSTTFCPDSMGMIFRPEKINRTVRYIKRNCLISDDELFNNDLCFSALTSICFSQNRFVNQSLAFADLSFSSFHNCNLSNISFNHAVLFKTDFRSCLLGKGCDFCNTNLNYILYNDDTIFDGAIVNARTILPENINVRHVEICPVDYDFEGHWKYSIPNNCFSFT